jgi:AcrR family transcriptional regulator
VLKGDLMSDAPIGRPRTIAPHHIAAVALELFTARDFDAVSMDDVAAAAGVSRRSVFRLFPTKGSLVWGGFDEFIERVATALRALPADVDGDTAVCAALVTASAFPPDDQDVTRRRLLVIDRNPSLASEGAVQHSALTQVLRDALADRDGTDHEDLGVTVRAAARAAEATAALTWWARNGSEPPEAVVERALGGSVSRD